MDDNFLNELYESHQIKNFIPSRRDVCLFVDELQCVMFPQMACFEITDISEIKSKLIKAKNALSEIISKLECRKECAEDFVENKLPIIYSLLLKDAEAICQGDPAAHNVQEVIRIYPGFLAMFYHRIAHEFYKMDIKYLPRILSEEVHSKTGIDIHPGAEIGEYFCIDHGTGVVIGETTKIGKWVKIYQGVTLGALSIDKSMANTKRHPTIEDHVVLYAGATILGGDTVIGQGSIVGGNTWLTKSTKPNSKTYYYKSHGHE